MHSSSNKTNRLSPEQKRNSYRNNNYACSASPGQQPRTPGPPAARLQCLGHVAPPGPQPEEELQQNPDQFSDNVHKRGKAAKELVNGVFHETIERARDRNMR